MVSFPDQRPTAVQEKSITTLRGQLEALGHEEQARAARMLRVTESEGLLVAPESMYKWIQGLFGSVQAVERQTIVKTTNLVTYEGTLFNALRSSRPMETELPENLDDIVNGGVGDPFCHPLEGTPADVFGRVQGRYGITASNIAKYDAFHGVVIFNHHNPLRFERDEISNQLDIGLEWAHRVLEADSQAKYFFYMWNCMWKSGASILHGHAQVASTREVHYAKVEHLRAAAAAYRERYGSNYFQDLVATHRALGLTLEHGDTTILASLTPIKEKEVWLVADSLTRDMRDAIYRVLHCYTARLGVTSFNLVVYMPPLAPAAEDWSGFPVITRIVDRGPLANKTADMGAMELYASSVVSSDPFKVADALAREPGL